MSLRIKEQLDVFPTDAGTYQVRGPDSLSVLKGTTVAQLLQHLLPLLDGRRSIDELISEMAPVAGPQTVQALIRKLEESGVVEEAADREPVLSPEESERYRSQVSFFKAANAGVDGEVCQRALLDSKVSIIGGGELAARIARECAQAGVGSIFCFETEVNAGGVNPSPGGQNGNGSAPPANPAVGDAESIARQLAAEPPSLLVLALDAAQPKLLDEVNRLSQELQVPLLHSRINLKEGIVGPLVVPGETACLKCHHLRVIRNYNFYDEHLDWEKWIDGEGRQRRLGGAALSPLVGAVAGLATLEIVKKLSAFHEPELLGRFLTVNALTLEVISHQVLRVPRCPSCGKRRDRAGFTPWIKDERAESQGRLAYRRPGHIGENGGGR